MIFKSILALMVLLPTFTFANQPLVIAHRGASGYLPDHTLAGKAMAHQMSPDFIEQDVVMTKDDQLVVLHDLYLNHNSDVAEKFPNRARADGKFYVIDFTFDELKTLRISSAFYNDANQIKAKYPRRFPLFSSAFSVHTFAQEIELIQGLNQVTGKQIGIYPEIKAPWFHQQQGKDITKAVLMELKKYGYQSKQDNIYLQSFDPVALKRIKTTLFAELNMQVKLVQLVAETNWQETQVLNNNRWTNYNYDNMLTKQGLQQVAQYADGIGPWHGSLIIEGRDKTQAIKQAKEIVSNAQTLGLAVHPYTFRKDDLPWYVNSYKDWVFMYKEKIHIDGIFTDFTAETIDILKASSDQ